MAEKTAIAWTRSTFNPWIGCTKIGPGCDHCYAETLDARHKWGGAVHWGAGVPRYRTSEHAWKQPLAWERKAAAGDKPWRVFCASLADVFDNEVPAEWRADLMKLIVDTPHLSWLLVTKRIGNVPKMIEEAGDLIDYGEGWQSMWGQGAWPDHVRLLITVCNQEEADRDIPKLLALPCKNGVSYEPALGPVDWLPFFRGFERPAGYRVIEWVIVGGESTQGKGKARPFDLAWARSTIEQCRAAGVPVFVKQLGSHPVSFNTSPHDNKLYDVAIKNRAGADPTEWPEDLRVQEFPS